MADETPPSPEAVDADGSAKRLSSKKLILFIVLPLLLLFGIGAGLYMGGVLDGMLGKKPAAEKEAAANGPDTTTAPEDKGGTGHYYDLPDLIVNLSDGGNKQRFLKLSISLEIPSKEDEPKVVAIMPRITDQFQTYLRELRVDDLRGSAGIYRLRQELLARVRSAADTVVVRDVLFREILVQ